MSSPNIQHVSENKSEILNAIKHVSKFRRTSMEFGDGKSVDKFINIIKEPDFWNIRIQKKFIDYEITK